MLAAILCSPSLVLCGTITNHVTTNVTVHETGKIIVNDIIRNSGDDSAYNVTVTTFLGNDARHSYVLGENRPGGSLQYGCDFDGTALNPGRYILITRINFTERNGKPHWIHHFHPFDIRVERAGGDSLLTLKPDTPSVNLKNLFGANGSIRLSLKNEHPVPIEPAVFFAMPEGLRTEEGEKALRLNPMEEKTMEAPVAVTAASKGEVPYVMIVRYEAEKIHYARQVQGKVLVEEQPVMFRIFLTAGLALLLLLLLLAFGYRHFRGRRSGMP
jgi:hypothetical protein